jgi:hypothetical protein
MSNGPEVVGNFADYFPSGMTTRDRAGCSNVVEKIMLNLETRGMYDCYAYPMVPCCQRK